jgi:probable rRNA maturation factor
MPEGEQRRAPAKRNSTRRAAARRAAAGRRPRPSREVVTEKRGRASTRSGLRVIVTDDRGRPLDAGGLAAWVTRVAPKRARGTLSVAIVGDERVRTLNRTYRRKDYATDVLSFPAEDAPSRYLGDVVIARGVARRQAVAARHSEDVELKVLALHGLLHLLGYDHERDNGLMRRVEQRLRRKGGLREGLIERASEDRRRRR